MTEPEASRPRDGGDRIRRPVDGPRLAAAPLAAATTQRSTADNVNHSLDQADAALAALDGTSDALTGDAKPFHLHDFAHATPWSALAAPEPGHDGELDVTIELGRIQMYVADFLKLRKGSVVALDSLVGEPVEIFGAGDLVARGELLVMADNFCVRVTQLVRARVPVELRSLATERHS